MFKPRLLLTGGTGFLGQHLVESLQDRFEVDLLSRRSPDFLKGDLTHWNAGLQDLDPLRKRRYAGLVHLAALYDLKASASDCYLQNVAGSGIALRLAQSLSIPVFVNASSVAAAINSKLPVVKPYDLNFQSPFPDAYSESKAQAEKMIENWPEQPALKVNLRLGVLVGDARRGEIRRLDGPYHAPQALNRLRGFIEAYPSAFPLPGSETRRIPLVPVDAAAWAIGKMIDWALECGETGYKSYHLVPQQGVSARELYKSILKHLFIRNNGIQLVESVPTALMKKISKWVIRFPEEELSYLLGFPKYDVMGTNRILGEAWCPEFADYEKAFWEGYERFLSNR